MFCLYEVEEIRQVDDVNEVNSLLKYGWHIIDTYKTNSEIDFENSTIHYILGRTNSSS